MRQSRSIVFYAWASLAVQCVLVIGVTVFVLAGAAYQRSAVTALHARAQRMQLANLTLQSEFLEAQRALRGYQAIGKSRFLQSYYGGQDAFVLALNQLRGLAWRGLVAAVTAEAGSAEASFLAGDRATAARPGNATALYSQASASADRFLAQNEALQRRLTSVGSRLAAQSERTLGIGLPGTSAVLALGLLLPMAALAAALLWTSKPLAGITRMVRSRSLGDMTVRTAPGGPAEVRELATAINLLADKSDRLRTAEEERTRLLMKVHQASVRIRQHLHGGSVIQEAVTAIQDHLDVDFAWVGLVSGDEVRLGAGDSPDWDQIAGIAGLIPEGSVEWMREIYRERSSYCVQDLRAPEAGEIPAGIRAILLGLGASSLLLTPFGAGAELLGMITLLRNDPRKRWSRAELEAVEYLAEDIGRGLEHARLYEGEERLVAQLQSLDQAKNSFIAAASHDVRTPLTSILGNVELLTDGEAGPVPLNQARMLDAVQRNAWRLQTLIEDMLTISTIELGAFTSDLRPMDLASVVPAAAEIIRPAAAEAGLSFSLECPERGLVVEGDAEQLDRVLINLLSNAVKYTSRGGRVTLTAGEQGGYAVLTVADTGMGIPEPDQKSLFTRFFRASNAVARAIPGSGLGLSIVRTIIANHHGEVDLKSSEGVGTTVTVRLPLWEGAQPAPRAAVPVSRRPVPLPRRHPQGLR